MNSAYRYKREILVLDQEYSTFKGLQRIYRDAPCQISYFDAPHEFLLWLKLQLTPSVPSGTLYCLVVDVQFNAIFHDKWLLKRVNQCLVMFTGRDGMAAPLVRDLVNQGLADFLAKPFSLETAGLELERQFTRHEHAVAACAVFSCLTKRELQISQLLVQGQANADIAAHLGIALKTVKVHRANLFRKTGLKTVTDLLRAFDSYQRMHAPIQALLSQYGRK